MSERTTEPEGIAHFGGFAVGSFRQLRDSGSILRWGQNGGEMEQIHVSPNPPVVPCTVYAWRCVILATERANAVWLLPPPQSLTLLVSHKRFFAVFRGGGG